MVFFNTEPTIGAPLIGVIGAMEVEKAKGEESLTDEVFNAIKTGMMGPLAAIGDSLFASTANAILLSFGMGLALEGNLIGPIGFALIWSIFTIFFVIWGTRFGFRQGTNILDSPAFSEHTVAVAVKLLTILGLTVIGGLSAQFVNLSTTLSWTLQEKTTELQSIIDGLMPQLLPFLLVLGLWWLHEKKKISVMKLLMLIIVLGVIGGLLNVI